jgi:hypothetical protein
MTTKREYISLKVRHVCQNIPQMSHIVHAVFPGVKDASWFRKEELRRHFHFFFSWSYSP